MKTNYLILNTVLLASLIDSPEYVSALNLRTYYDGLSQIDDLEDHITADVFKKVEAADDDMANELIAELGFNHGVTNSAFTNSLSQARDGDEKKEGGDEKKEGGDEKKEGGDEKKEGGDEKKEGGDAKDGDADAKKAKKAANKTPELKSANKDEPKDYEKGTPAQILDLPDYMDQVNRFLPQFNQDPALEQATRNSTIPIDQSEITEEKEREGYYPTELD